MRFVSPFVSRFDGVPAPLVAIVPSSLHQDSQICVNLLDGTIRRDATILRLTRGERELACGIGLRGRPVPRQMLLADMWPDAEETPAIKAFKVRLHRLRARLGARNAIVWDVYGYAFGNGVTTDIRELEALSRCVGASPILSEFDLERLRAAYGRLAEAAAGDPIPSTRTYELLGQRIASLKRSFAEQLATITRDVHADRALEIGYEMIRCDACDEPGWEIVIRAHLARSDWVTAAREFRSYARQLDRELGLPPSTNLERLITTSPDSRTPR